MAGGRGPRVPPAAPTQIDNLSLSVYAASIQIAKPPWCRPQGGFSMGVVNGGGCMRVFYVLLDLADGRTLRLLTKQHTEAEARRFIVRWARYVLHVEVAAVLAAFPVEAVALLMFYDEYAVDNVANLAGVR